MHSDTDLELLFSLKALSYTCSIAADDALTILPSLPDDVKICIWTDSVYSAEQIHSLGALHSRVSITNLSIDGLIPSIDLQHFPSLQHLTVEHSSDPEVEWTVLQSHPLQSFEIICGTSSLQLLQNPILARRVSIINGLESMLPLGSKFREVTHLTLRDIHCDICINLDHMEELEVLAVACGSVTIDISEPKRLNLISIDCSDYDINPNLTARQFHFADM